MTFVVHWVDYRCVVFLLTCLYTNIIIITVDIVNFIVSLYWIVIFYFRYIMINTCSKSKVIVPTSKR